jgi:hypothetical protein
VAHARLHRRLQRDVVPVTTHAAGDVITRVAAAVAAPPVHDGLEGWRLLAVTLRHERRQHLHEVGATAVSGARQRRQAVVHDLSEPRHRVADQQRDGVDRVLRTTKHTENRSKEHEQRQQCQAEPHHSTGDAATDTGTYAQDDDDEHVSTPGR